MTNNLTTTVQNAKSARVWRALRKLVRDRRGAGYLEYIIIATIVAFGGMAGMTAIRDGIKDKGGQTGGAIGTIQPQDAPR